MNKKTKEKTEVEYALREIVLAKIRGYPAWPGMVVDPEAVPSAVTNERPKGGKSYCVRFFPAGDYAWLQSKDMTKLPRDDIESYVASPPPRKNNDLVGAYRVALDPAKWEEDVAKRAAAAEDAEADMEVDQLADGADGGSEGKSRKRKRSSVSAPKKGAAAADGESKKKPKRRAGKKNGVSAETVESEDDAAGEAAPKDEPAGKRKKTDKDDEDEKWAYLKSDPDAVKIKTVRHTLQKAFLGKTGPIEGEMEDSDKLFKELENQELSIEYLSYSKIGKVMRHIASIEEETMPKGDEFKFRKRAADLVARWHKILGTKTPLNGAAAGSTPAKKKDGEGEAENKDEVGDLTMVDESA